MIDMFERLSNLSPKRLALLAMELQERLDVAERAGTEAIAIVGMACRLPGADGIDAYWDLLTRGGDAIREVPRSRWDVDALYDPDPDAPGRIATRWAGLLDDVAGFEPQLFGISPREARSMDPQQRLMLEVAWEALEHAGIAPDSLHSTPTGVYAGLCNMDYAQLLMEGDPADFDMYLSTGNASSVASGRLSYVFGLNGPALTVDTACSSSLVAVHLAVQGLRNGSCRTALAGGVNVILSAKTTMTLSRARMMAADGRCKTFDAAADGFVRGEGCGVVVLKRLHDAVADGDRVLAVIRGSAVNQDGRSNGLTAPNGPAQVAVIRAALADARLEPDAVGYVEAHGTGTSLGDPIEVQALGAALGGGRGPDRRLLIGSAKTNIGHLESAAGVAGLIKAVLMFQHGEVPPSLHLHEPSPLIPWASLPIDVVTARTPWPRTDRPRIAGVSSFGFSGTNAHVLVEEAPMTSPLAASPPRGAVAVKLTARTPEALTDQALRWAAALRSQPAPDLASVARTANRGRADLAHRLVAVAADPTTLAAQLGSWAAGATPSGLVGGGPAPTRPGEVAWLFTGHGSQRAGMGSELYATEPVYRAAIDRCAATLAGFADDATPVPLTDVLDGPHSEELLTNMAYAQPAVFAVEYALAELWSSWGLQPSVVAGHSVGEYVAAVVAGVMSVEDGMALVAARGRLMASLPGDGEMATVLADEATVQPVLARHGGHVTIAAINGPASLALSATGGALAAVLDELRSGGVEVRPLAIPVAAHSPQVDPILDAFERVARGVTYHRPRIDVVSAMSGALATADDLQTARWWRDHLRRPVLFADAITVIHQRGVRTFVELGPHPTLLNMARHTVPEHGSAWLHSLRAGHEDRTQILAALGRLYADGHAVDWRAVGSAAPVVSLPSYPFQRERYWTTAQPSSGALRTGGRNPLLGAAVSSPALAATVFETELAATWPAFLDHHRVFGTVLLPSPAYLEMAMAAAGGEADVEAFEIRAALVLPDDAARIVQTVVHDSDGSTSTGRAFEIVSRAPDGPEWTLHATGRLVPAAPAAAVAPLDVDAVRAECDEHISGEAYYARLTDLGLEFGESFRGVRDVWRRDGAALGRVELPDLLAGEAEHYRIHPALLDACFHVLGAAMTQVGDGHASLLVGIDSFRLLAPPGRTLWNHTVVRPGGASGVTTADVRLFGLDGTLVAVADGIHLRRTDRATLARSAQRAGQDWYYELAWTPLAGPGAVGAAGDEADVAGTSHEHWVLAGDAAAMLGAFGASGDRITDVGRDHDELDRVLAASASTGGCRVLFGVRTGSDVVAAVTDAVWVVRAASSRGAATWFVTVGAQPAGAVVPDPGQAALWGLGRVAAVEHPDTWGGLIDLPPAGAGASPGAHVAAAVRDAATEDQLAIRGSDTLVPRVVRRATPPTAVPALRHDAAYLVTGGLGGLGLHLLRWLAVNGAGTIVLTGRTGLPDRDEWSAPDLPERVTQQVAAIQEAEEAGSSVIPVTADVTDRAAMSALFARFGTTLPPLAGVVHAAAALGNMTIDDLDDSQIAAMLAPKVAGTELLDELTADHPLDFFVLFSSTTALWGSRHLGHYAAANQYADAVAHRRRSAGRPGLSVNWGTWDEMRVASTVERASVAGSGLRPMPTGLALQALGSLIGVDAAQVAVADIDWPVLKAAYAARRPRPMFDDVGPLVRAGRGGARRGAGVPELVTRLDGKHGVARREVVLDFIRVEVARALAIADPWQVDEDQGLFEMGMDSLMSVELKGRIEVAVGADLPSTLTFNYPTVAALAGFVVTSVLPDAAVADAAAVATDAPGAIAAGDVRDAATPGSAAAASDGGLAGADDMSEDELAAMLSRRLAGLRGTPQRRSATAPRSSER